MDTDPISAVMVWVGAYGLVSLFAVALAERFVPLLPSYGLLLAVGIGAAEGAWSLSSATLTTIIGSFLGCAASFYAVRALGEARSTRFLNRAGRLFGMSPDRIERWIAAFRRNQTVLAFTLQLVPTVRLFAPAFAALLGARPRSFLAASAVGIMLWNGLFVGLGYAASQSMPEANTTVLALAVLGCLLALEATLFWIAGRVRARANSDVTP